MYCLAVDSGGFLRVVGVEPCADSSLVALTMSELQTKIASPFYLSLAEGGAVTGAILSVWAVAFAVRALSRTLASGEPER